MMPVSMKVIVVAGVANTPVAVTSISENTSVSYKADANEMLTTNVARV